MNRTIVIKMFCLCFIMFPMLSSCSVTRGNLAPSPVLSEYKNKKIAIIDVTKPRKYGLDWTIIVAGVIRDDFRQAGESRLTTALMSTGKFRVIERARLEKVLNEHEILLSGLIAMDSETAKKVGKLVGIDGIIFVETKSEGGWVFPCIFGFSEMSARLVDIKSGEVVMSANADANGFSIIPVVPFWVNPPKVLANKIASKVKKYYKKH